MHLCANFLFGIFYQFANIPDVKLLKIVSNHVGVENMDLLSGFVHLIWDVQDALAFAGCNHIKKNGRYKPVFCFVLGINISSDEMNSVPVSRIHSAFVVLRFNNIWDLEIWQLYLLFLINQQLPKPLFSASKKYTDDK